MTMIGMNEVSVVRAMPRWGNRQKESGIKREKEMEKCIRRKRKKDIRK